MRRVDPVLHISRADQIRGIDHVLHAMMMMMMMMVVNTFPLLPIARRSCLRRPFGFHRMVTMMMMMMMMMMMTLMMMIVMITIRSDAICIDCLICRLPYLDHCRL